MSITPNQLLFIVREQFSEPDATFNTNEGVYRYMSDAETELANLVPCAEATDTSITTVADQREYDFPTGVQRISKVTWDSYPLKKIDLKDLDALEYTSYGNSGETGSPEYYYEFANQIGFSPVPLTAKTVKLYYLADPATITSESTAFTVPGWLAQYIGDYCLYRMYLKDKEASRSELHLNIWMRNKANAQNEWAKRTSRNRIRIVKDESEYPNTTLGII